MGATLTRLRSNAAMRSRSQGLCLVEGTAIAGTRHVAGIREKARAFAPGRRFTFERDRDNLYDPWAVRVLDEDRERLGYVSCECNEVVARLIDGGKRVHGSFSGVEYADCWTRIEMGVYLDD